MTPEGDGELCRGKHSCSSYRARFCEYLPIGPTRVESAPALIPASAIRHIAESPVGSIAVKYASVAARAVVDTGSSRCRSAEGRGLTVRARPRGHGRGSLGRDGRDFRGHGRERPPLRCRAQQYTADYTRPLEPLALAATASTSSILLEAAVEAYRAPHFPCLLEYKRRATPFRSRHLSHRLYAREPNTRDE